MKRLAILIIALAMLFACTACNSSSPAAMVAATTLPVYEFTARLCADTPITVTRLIGEQVSCLHDYSLSVTQVKAVENAQLVVISGGGLEDFMEDLLSEKVVSNSSKGLALNHCEDSHHDGHHHETDPHFWLSPAYAKEMTINICRGLQEAFPDHSNLFEANLQTLISDLDALQDYGNAQLSDLSCRQLISFHDGFSYFAKSFHLEILKAVEEESGSEASAAELKELIALVRQHNLPAIFTEKNGSVSAAQIISAETGAKIYSLDMAMAGNSYFDAMRHNIDTIKEALG